MSANSFQQQFMEAVRAYNEVHTETVHGRGRWSHQKAKPFTTGQLDLLNRIAYLAGLPENDGVVRGTRAFIRGTATESTYKRTVSAAVEHGFLERENLHRGEGRGTALTLWPVIPEIALQAIQTKKEMQEQEKLAKERAKLERSIPPSQRRNKVHSDATKVHSEMTSAHSDTTSDHIEPHPDQNEPTSAQNDTIKTAHFDTIINGSLLVESNNGTLSLERSAHSATEGEMLDSEIIEEEEHGDAARLVDFWKAQAQEQRQQLIGSPAQHLASAQMILDSVSLGKATEVIWWVFKNTKTPCFKRNDPQWVARNWATFTSFQAPPDRYEQNRKLFESLRQSEQETPTPQQATKPEPEPQPEPQADPAAHDFKSFLMDTCNASKREAVLLISWMGTREWSEQQVINELEQGNTVEQVISKLKEKPVNTLAS